MTLTLKAPGASNRWKLIYLDHKTQINLKGAVAEQQLRLQPSPVWCWLGDRDMLDKPNVENVESTDCESLCSTVPPLSLVLSVGCGDLITEK